MSDYRIYRRASTVGYDGATADTAVYTQTRYQWVTSTDTAVGEWASDDLGRQSVASIVSVAADLVGPGDLVEAVSDSGTVRASTSLSVAGTPWLFLFPQDSLRVTSATARTLQIAVNDLDDTQITKWFACCGGGGNPPSGDCCDYSEQSFAAPNLTIAAWAGKLTAFANFGGVDGPLTLPPLADIALGDSVTIVRVGPGDVQILTDLVTDNVNGVTGSPAEFWLRNTGEAVTYTRVSGGWTRKQGEQAPGLQTVSAFPAIPAPWSEGTQYAQIVPVAGTGAYTLPSLATQNIGTRLLLVNVGTGTSIVQPFAGQTIDGSTGSRNLRLGDSIMLEAAETNWVTGRGDESPDPISSAISVILPVFRGTQHVEITGAGAGVTVTLPATAGLDDPINTVAMVYNNSASRIRLDPAGVDTIDGALTLGLNPGSRAFVVSSAAGLWTSIVTQAPAATITSAANVVLGSALDAQVVYMTGGVGQDVALPAVSATISPAGARVIVFNNSANAHTITPFGADTIDGAGAPVASAAGEKHILTSDGVAGWILVTSA